MITRVGSLYQGHVDLNQIGFDGIPVNERRCPDRHLATAFEKATAVNTGVKGGQKFRFESAPA